LGNFSQNHQVTLLWCINVVAILKGRAPGLPDFLDTIYQNGEKYTKIPQHYVPNGHKVYQMAVKYSK
jgi:hypothetical protein